MDFSVILHTTLKKSAIFTIVADYIGDEEIQKMTLDILNLIKINKSDDQDEELTIYFIETFDFFNIEIEEKEAEHLARIIKWEYDEFLIGKYDTYKSITNSKQPEHQILDEGSSSED